MGIRLQRRDVELLMALHTARYMTAPQIAALFWRESKPGTKDPHASKLRASQRRLRQLAEEELVRRIEIPVKMGEGRKPYVYALAKGAVPILESVGISGDDVEWKQKPREENSPFLEHLLASVDFRIALTLACEQHPDVTLVEWMDERELKRDPDRVEIKSKRGKQQSVAIVPDAAFTLRIVQAGGKAGRIFRFVEIDRATVTVEPSKWKRRGWAKKVRAYLSYLDRRTVRQGGGAVTQFTARYGAPTARILTVTTTDLRLANLKAATEKVGGGSLFWFTTFEQVTSETVLTAPIWQEAGKPASNLQTMIRE